MINNGNKNVLKIVFIISALNIFNLFFINSQQREMVWIKSKDSKISSFKTDINNLLTESFKTLTNQSFYTESSLDSVNDIPYYLNSSNIALFDQNEEYLTIQRINSIGRHNSFIQICSDNWWWYDSWTQCSDYVNFTVTSNMRLYLNNNWNRDYDSSQVVVGRANLSLSRKGGVWVGWNYYYYWKEKDSESSNHSYDFIINPESSTSPMVSNSLFETYPIVNPTLNYWDEWNQKPGPDNTASYYTNCILESNNVYLYKAKTPKPNISSTQFNSVLNSYVYPFSPSLEIHNKELATINISTSYGVKIIAANIYKIDGDNNTLKYSKTRSISSSSELNGINDLTILDSEINNAVNEEGHYVVILGAVDKFNKIYYFEPEYFLIDKTNPVVSDISVNNINEGNLRLSDPYIVSWSGMSDNFTSASDYANVADYIYVKLSGDVDEVPLSQKAGIFSVNNNKVNLILENQRVYIEQMYAVDKAGNKTVLFENKSFYLNTKKPVVSVINQKSYYGSTDNVLLNIDSSSNIKISSLYLTFNGITYQISHSSDFSGINQVEVPLSVLGKSEGTFVLHIDVINESNNDNDNKDFTLKLDSKNPEINLSLKENIANDIIGDVSDANTTLLNHQKTLVLNFNDLNLENYDLAISSDVSDSSTIITKQTFTGTAKEIILLKSASVDKENIKIDITANDKAGNQTKIVKNLSLYDDSSPPVIQVTKKETGRYNIIVTDKSKISAIYTKFVDLPSNDIIDINNFLPMPPGTDWVEQASNIETFNKDLYILPRHGACVVAEDIWHNITDSSSSGIFMENELPKTFFEINNKQDLDAIGWTVYGWVIFKTGLSIDTGETLNIISNTADETKVYFDSGVGQIKLTTNGGTININSNNNNILFQGSGTGDLEYKWFGLQNISGEINFIGNNRIKFVSAVSPLSYLNPSSNIILSNLDFDDCMMGVHFIDNCSSYNNLTINNSTFNNIVYGIKFDFDSYTNAGLYGKSSDHLIRNNCSFTNVYKGNVYCPVTGLNN
jgi:hypothetical protein